jgi:hypothetical protein
MNMEKTISTTKTQNRLSIFVNIIALFAFLTGISSIPQVWYLLDNGYRSDEVIFWFSPQIPFSISLSVFIISISCVFCLYYFALFNILKILYKNNILLSINRYNFDYSAIDFFVDAVAFFVGSSIFLILGKIFLGSTLDPLFQATPKDIVGEFFLFVFLLIFDILMLSTLIYGAKKIASRYGHNN